MSGVRRFLSRREKSPHARTHLLHRKDNQLADAKEESSKPAPPPAHYAGVFVPSHDHSRKPDKEEEKKIKGILERLRHYGIDHISEVNAEYALRSKSSQGDPEAAFRLLMLLEDTYEGIVKPYNPTVKLLGAVNRDAVTCYLDALLFAMFVRLDSFEAMLYDNFDDAKRKRLAGLIRLWVNLLRTGRLITTDLTEQIQRALAGCGWLDAAQSRQQDPSEAFTFITGQLELPMLTLKMDMFHVGKEDPHDDHKFVNERLLEVAILDEPVDGKDQITLEDCLEHYFNSRIEVKRHLENQRRNTLKSANMDSHSTSEKESAAHIEVAEVTVTPVGSPAVATPVSEVPTQTHHTPFDTLRPNLSRKRGDSIFSQRRLDVSYSQPGEIKGDDANTGPDSRLRKMSTRTEVLMPAWQFFKLLPWYTANMPTSDAQVAAHFSKKRPVLGICLKRYSYTNTGQSQRRDTYVDIPLEIAVPNFVSDDHLHDESPLVGNFRLMLQSVVCHRGVSLDSGHYICLSRGQIPPSQDYTAAPEQQGSTDGDNPDDSWMRFDDLARERVSLVDINEALRQEMPYLLFYQVQPIGDDGHSIHDLPTYEEATSRSQSDATPLEKPFTQSDLDPKNRSSADIITLDSNGRTSLDAATVLHDPPRGRTASESDPSPRQSIATDTSNLSANTTGEPSSATPPEDESNSGSNRSTLLYVANKLTTSRRGSKANPHPREASHSRPSSRDDNKRSTLSKLTQMVSNKSNDGAGVSASPAIVPQQEQQLASEHDNVGPEGASGRQSTEKLAQNPMTNIAFPAPNASKESLTTASKGLPKLRRDKMGGGGRRKGESGKQHEDRDCVLM